MRRLLNWIDRQLIIIRMGIFRKMLALAAAVIVPTRVYRERKEPHYPVHRGIRLTKANQSHRRVVIVGSGIVGCSAAYFLAKNMDRAKTSIEVVDTNPLPCMECSEWNGRQVNANIGYLWESVHSGTR